MVITSIDLMDGKSVQLYQGKKKMLEHDDVLTLAQNFNRYGKTAVIDLDAAMGRSGNNDVIKKILRIAECRVGGGITSTKRAKQLIALGATKVIIGSKAFQCNRINHKFLNALIKTIGREKVIIAVDSYNGEIVTRAWTHSTGLKFSDIVGEIEPYCSEFLYTCVEREGTLTGTDFEVIKEITSLTDNKITVAGGIHTLEEIKECAAYGVEVQIGMALYTGKIILAEAFAESLNWKSGLIPTIVQDDTGQVLMLAYSNRDSLKKTFETGKMWYYSRSRNRLWMKGEVSNHVQEIVKLRADCDRDSLLATVRQKGVACHRDDYSCFGSKTFSLHELYGVLRDRITKPRYDSYTSQLTDVSLRKKIIEEAQEIVTAKNKNEIIWETADIMYFLIVLLAKSDVNINDVFFELRKRRRKKY